MSEPLQELSKKTLRSYIKRSIDDKSDSDYAMGHTDAKFPFRGKESGRDLAQNNIKRRFISDRTGAKLSYNDHIRRANKRKKGIVMAADKLGEEVLQELSKKTLRNYVWNSAIRATDHSRREAEYSRDRDTSGSKRTTKMYDDLAKKERHKTNKRLKGIVIATHKLATKTDKLKEETGEPGSGTQKESMSENNMSVWRNLANTMTKTKCSCGKTNHHSASAESPECWNCKRALPSLSAATGKKGGVVGKSIRKEDVDVNDDIFTEVEFDELMNEKVQDALNRRQAELAAALFVSDEDEEDDIVPEDGVSEEKELQELSKGKLRSYVGAAKKQLRNIDQDTGYDIAHGNRVSRFVQNTREILTRKRDRGIDRAEKKLREESLQEDVTKSHPKGARVELHAATDDWMRGDRHGTIVGHGRTRQYINSSTRKSETSRPVLVKLDKSGKVKRFHPSNVNLHEEIALQETGDTKFVNKIKKRIWSAGHEDKEHPTGSVSGDVFVARVRAKASTGTYKPNIEDQIKDKVSRKASPAAKVIRDYHRGYGKYNRPDTKSTKEMSKIKKQREKSRDLHDNER